MDDATWDFHITQAKQQHFGEDCDDAWIADDSETGRFDGRNARYEGLNLNTTSDALVGLRFELNGGLGRMAGVVVGKAGDLYLVQRDETDHMELLELSDLRSARFMGGPSPVAAPRPATAQSSGSTRLGSGGRLSDKIRRSANADESGGV